MPRLLVLPLLLLILMLLCELLVGLELEIGGADELLRRFLDINVQNEVVLNEVRDQTIFE